MNAVRLVAAAALAASCCAGALAQDKADIDRTQIIGNRELPKVLYIVPWKKPLPGDLSGRPLVSVLDEAMAPVDRDVFRRQVNYDAQTQAQALAATSTSTPTPTPARTATPPSAAPVAAPAPAAKTAATK
jgi:hypothetical protein